MIYEQITRSGRSMLAGSILVGLLVTTIAYGQPAATPSLEGYVGSYELSATSMLTITLEGESLYAQTTGQAKYKLVPLADHRFSSVGSPRELVFTVGGDGKASSVTQTLDGATQTAKRTDRPMTPPSNRPGDTAPLADAVLAGNLELVRKLVADGADIQGLDTRPQVAGANGRRPLNFAALKNDTKMIELLLELGADINGQNLTGFTPLHHAVEAEAIEAITLLLSKGADTTIKNGRNLTPAEFARASQRSRAMKALGVGAVAE